MTKPNPTVNNQLIPAKLPNFPVTLFAIIMGSTGLAIAWDRLPLLDPIGDTLGLLLAVIASTLFFLLLLVYLMKIILHRPEVIAELRHPIRINFFPTISISFLLLSAYWRQSEWITTSLWITGAALHLALTLYIMSSWIHHTHYEINHINPGWFIPVVGNIIVPITGTYLGYTEISWFFFSIGIVFWIVLFTVVMYRLIFHDPMPARITPMMFILLAPPSIGFVSYTLLTQSIDNFARILYYTGVFIALLLGSNIIRFIKLPFFVSSWAYSFPIAALAIATIRFAELTQLLVYNQVALALLILLSALVVWLTVKTVVAALKNKVCVPE